MGDTHDSREMDVSKHSRNDNQILSKDLFNAYQELIRESIASDITGGTHVVDEFSHAVHNGDAYSVSSGGTIPGETTVYMLSLGGDKAIHFGEFSLATSKGLITLALYEDSIIEDNGTLLTPLNRNRESTNTATKFTYSGADVSDVGTLLEKSTIYDTGGVGSHNTQGFGSIDSQWVLSPDRVYVLAITNEDSTEVDFNGTFMWIEH